MNKLVFVQGIATSYRVPVFEEMADKNPEGMCVVADRADESFGEVDYKTNKLEYFEARWLKIKGIFFPKMNAMKKICSHDTVIHVGDFKFFSLWVCLFYFKLNRKRIFLHGQGGYKSNSFLAKAVYLIAVYLSDGYICYTEFSKQNMISKLPKALHKKVFVCDNSLIMPQIDTSREASAERLFYIGRIRPGCGIEILLKAAQQSNVAVDILGKGDAILVDELKKQFPSAEFHGPVFQNDEQLKIANKCFAGVYGGDAGLSVVHYMAFGLPVIVHSSYFDHMGPEPSYVQNNYNGLTFIRNSVNDLSQKINTLRNDFELQKNLSNGALLTFQNLSKPSMADKFLNIIKR